MTDKPAIRAILFDKDGTLFDFRRTWDNWAKGMIAELSRGSEATAKRIADAIHFDLVTGMFRPTSPVIAGTNREAAELVAHALGHREIGETEDTLARMAADADVAEVVPLRDWITSLRQRGLKLGVMTNDAEAVAHAHLGRAGVGEMFDFIAGFDSGHGAKPDPAPLLAFAEQVNVAADACLMVGDSSHDLLAARAAGMPGLGVLTGLATHEELLPFATAIVPDIGHLEEWLDSTR